MANSNFREKMDALDLIINVLKDHESRLDEISGRLEAIVGELKIRGEEKGREVLREKRVVPTRKRPVVRFDEWDEFKASCQDGDIIAFQVESNAFHVYSISGDNILRYSETFPKEDIVLFEGKGRYSIDKSRLKSIDDLTFLISGRLRCGLQIGIDVVRTVLPGNKSKLELEYKFDTERVKDFLSRELKAPWEKIVVGKVTF